MYRFSSEYEFRFLQNKTNFKKPNIWGWTFERKKMEEMILKKNDHIGVFGDMLSEGFFRQKLSSRNL